MLSWKGRVITPTIRRLLAELLFILSIKIKMVNDQSVSRRDISTVKAKRHGDLNYGPCPKFIIVSEGTIASSFLQTNKVLFSICTLSIELTFTLLASNWRFAKRRKLFPLYRQQGTRCWAASMSWLCWATSDTWQYSMVGFGQEALSIDTHFIKRLNFNLVIYCLEGFHNLWIP